MTQKGIDQQPLNMKLPPASVFFAKLCVRFCDLCGSAFSYILTAKYAKDFAKNAKQTPIGSVLLVCVLVGLFGVAGCGASANKQLTPDAARRFVQLRGYEFTEKGFMSAVAANDVAGVNAFLNAGMNPNTKDEETATPVLVAAAVRDHDEMVRALLQGGADVNAKDFGGYTALLRALEKESEASAALLLAQTTLDLNAQGANGMTALNWCVLGDREGSVQKLLERGANPNLSDKDGDGPLHNAAQRGDVKLLDLLLAAGANANAKNKLGGTPLMWAAVYGHEPAASLLMAKGADPALKDNGGRTASAWAEKNQRAEMAQFLRNAEKKK
jgi:ankyrin repeat protein